MIVLFGLLIITPAMALPDILYRAGSNITRLHNIVEDMPEEYFEGIPAVEFQPEYDSKYRGLYQYRCIVNESAWADRVIIYGTEHYNNTEITCTLLHELGHHLHLQNSPEYFWNDMANDTYVEYYANSFMSRHNPDCGWKG